MFRFLIPFYILLPLSLSGYLLIIGITGIFISNQLVSIIYRSAFVYIALLAIYEQFKRHQFKINFNFVSLSYIVFYLFYIGRVIFDLNSLYVTNIPQINYILFTVLLTFIPSLFFLYDFKSVDINEINILCIFILSITTSIIFIRFLFDINIIRLHGRVFLPRINAVAISQIASSTIILCLSSLLYIKRKITIHLPMLFIIITSTFVMISSGSRGPFFSLFITLNILLIFYLIKKIKYLFLIFLMQLLFIFLAYYYSSYLNLLLVDRFFSTGSSLDSSTSERLLLILNSWAQFQNHPLFGDFIELRNGGIFPHNIFFETLMSCGIFGFLLLLCLLGNAFFLSLQIIAKRDYPWIGALLMHNIFYSLFSGALWDNAPLFILILFANSVNSKKLPRRKLLRHA